MKQDLYSAKFKRQYERLIKMKHLDSQYKISDIKAIFNNYGLLSESYKSNFQ